MEHENSLPQIQVNDNCPYSDPSKLFIKLKFTQHREQTLFL
jgi:hypothetical protein